ncbi:MAG: hypothetical protein GY822_21255 [Deltaproteobacteria bacterium]|nr:hypothetical protein [Deltaproteobacteria bacterium]
MSNHAKNEAKRRKATRPRKDEALPSTSSSTRKASRRKRSIPQMRIRGGIVRTKRIPAIWPRQASWMKGASFEASAN